LYEKDDSEKTKSMMQKIKSLCKMVLNPKSWMFVYRRWRSKDTESRFWTTRDLKEKSKVKHSNLLQGNEESTKEDEKIQSN